MDTAYWIERDDGLHYCSACGCCALERQGYESLSFFCPTCGKRTLIKVPEYVFCSECIGFDECENKENCDGCYAGEREDEVDE